MRILCHNCHTGYDAEMAKTGHDFFALRIPTDFNGLGDVRTEWDADVRPLPANWTMIDDPAEARADLAVAYHSDVAETFSALDLPLVFNNINDCSEGVFPQDLEDRSSVVAFLGSEVADRWAFKNPEKKRVIHLGIDDRSFHERRGDGPGDILTVGHHLPKRWDKGHCPLTVFHQAFHRIDLVGQGNQDLPSSIGSVPHARLLEMYRDYKIYFNPGPVIGISVAEAMMAGMPVVTMPPINLKSLFQNGRNGFVVETLDGAAMRVRALLADAGLRRRVGRAARETALRWFSLDAFTAAWNELLQEVAGERKQ